MIPTPINRISMNLKEENCYYTGYLVMMNSEALASAWKLGVRLEKINCVGAGKCAACNSNLLDLEWIIV